MNAMGALRQQIDEYTVNANILKDYLYNLHVLVQPSQQIDDKVDPQGAPFGDGFLTDGYWIIPFEAATYITRYAMGVPVDFLFHVQQIGGAPARPDDNRMYQMWEELQAFLQNGGSLYGPANGPVNTPAQPPAAPPPAQPEPQVPEPQAPPEPQETAWEEQAQHPQYDPENDPYAPIRQPEETLVSMPSPEEVLKVAPVLSDKSTISDRERLRNLLNQMEQDNDIETPDQKTGSTFYDVIEEFIQTHEGFSDNQCKIIVGIVDLLMDPLPHEALTLRERVKTQEEKKYEVTTMDAYETIQDMIITKLGGSAPSNIEKTATPEGWINIDPVNASRVAAAEFFGRMAASAELADISSEWREMQFGWRWEENLFYAISMALDSHQNIENSFHIGNSGFQYK